MFLGTPDAAVPPLRALVDAGFVVPLVVSRADRRRGRRGPPEPSPVKRAARGLGIPVTDAVDGALTVDADLGVVVAFGRVIKPHVLDALAMINLHFSLLPRWRGAAPVERAILAGDDTTGVCVMAVEEGLDTGGVYARTTVDVGPTSTAAQLREQLISVGTPLLVETLRCGLGIPEPQVGEVTYADKVTADDVRLDWERPAQQLVRRVRVGGAWTTFRGRRLKVNRATSVEEPGPGRPGELHGALVTTGHGTLELIEVQPEGRASLPVQAWRNGAHPAAAERLGDRSEPSA